MPEREFRPVGRQPWTSREPALKKEREEFLLWPHIHYSTVEFFSLYISD